MDLDPYQLHAVLGWGGQQWLWQLGLVCTLVLAARHPRWRHPLCCAQQFPHLMACVHAARMRLLAAGVLRWHVPRIRATLLDPLRCSCALLHELETCTG